MTKNEFIKAQLIVRERVKSLTDDGYVVMFQTFYDTWSFYKLRHLMNGHYITLYADYLHNSIKQTTDGEVTHSSSILTALA